MAENLKVSIKNLDVHYGDKQALFNVNLNIMEKEVTSLIGPSGCGKSTSVSYTHLTLPTNSLV